MGSLSEGLSHRDGTDLGALVVCQEQRQQHHCSHYYDLGPRGTRDRWKTRSVASLRPVRCNQVPTCQEGQGSCLWVLPLGFAFGFRLWVSPSGFAFAFCLRVLPFVTVATEGTDSTLWLSSTRIPTLARKDWALNNSSVKPWPNFSTSVRSSRYETEE